MAPRLVPLRVADVRYRARSLVAGRRWTFKLLTIMRRYRYSPIVVSRDKRIVIEGFPRSANTYAYAYFALLNPRFEKLVGRHTHASAQVAQACKWEIPTLVLVRRPEDAVLSLCVREGIRVISALHEYVRFYRNAAQFLDSIVVATFDEVTNAFPLVLERVNRKFGTAFFSGPIGDEREVFSYVEELERKDSGGEIRVSHVATPRKARAALRDAVLPEWYTVPKELRGEADALYDLLSRRSEGQSKAS